ncbi:carbohydrate-binding protein, partial [Salipiger pacificus]|nr:carbohydrate-binding protein [Alloyangia pacifica]
MPIDTIFIQGEALITDTVDELTGADANVARTRSGNQEAAGIGSSSSTTNTGLPNYDEYGLRPDYTGDGDEATWGYYDINGNDTGAQASTTFDAVAGTYEITLRIANGNTNARPISITVDGVTYAITDTRTGQFYFWETRTVEVTLSGSGTHDLVINQTSTAGSPNIDAIAIHDVGVTPNFSLPTFESEASFVVADGSMSVGSVLATDIANDTSADAPSRPGMTYAIAGGDDAAAFTIDAATGALSLIADADFDAQASYAVTVSATDAEGGVTEQALTVSVVPPFAPIYLGVDDIEVLDPVGTGTLKRTVDENPESGAVEGGTGDNTGPEDEGNLFDDFGLRHNYSGSGYIDINGTTVGDRLSFTFDAPAGTYDITVRYANGSDGQNRPISLAVDGGDAQTLTNTNTGDWSTWASHSFTVTVGDGTHTVVLAQTGTQGAPNIDAVAIALPGAPISFAAPEILSAAAFEIAENSTEIGQVEVDDPELSDLDPDLLTYTLTGDDADKVEVSATGLLTLKDPADFESRTDADLDGIFEVTLEVSDGVRSVTQELSITVTDVEPELPSPTIAPIVLQSESGVIPDGASTFHRVQNDPSTAEGSGNQPQDLYGLREGYSGFGYTDFDGAGADGDELITWTVTVAETGLYDLHIRYASVESTQTDRPLAVLVNGADAVGGTIGFPERDGFDTWVVRAPVQIALQAGENSLTFAIPSGVSNGPNIDAIAITSVGDTPAFPATNSAPEFDTTADAVSIAENSTEVAVGLTATDGEGDALSYELTGDDAALFEFNETTGALDFVTAPDFEAPSDVGADNVYNVTLTTSDGVLTKSQNISVTVTDVVEATQPNSIALDASAVAENAAGAVIGTLSAVDPDGDDAAITFSVDPASDFEVVGGQLKLKDGVALDFEATPSVDVAITATDAANETTTTTLTITVGDVDEAPSQPQITGLAVDSGVAGAIIGTVSSVDPEGTAVSFTVDDARFQIDGDDQLTLRPGESLDFGSEPTVSVEVTAFDDTGQQSTQTFVITVNDPGASFEPIVIEAEDETQAVLTILDNDANTNDTQIRDPENPESNVNLVNGLRPGFSGDGYLDFGDTPGDAITFTVTVAAGGDYDFNVRYASNTGRPLDLSVNGVGAGSLPFASTDPDGTGPEEGFDHWLFETTTVTLVAGSNTISLAIPAGANTGPNVDRIEITEAGTGPIPEPDTTADEGGDLAAAPEATTIAPAGLGAVDFALAGVDDDITLIEVSTDGGASFQTVTPVGDTVTLDLSAFAAETSLTVIFRVTDDAENTAETSAAITIGDAPEAFSTTIQLENRDGSIIILDDTGTGEGDVASTQFRDASNIEGVTADRPEGIWSGYTGTGYLDMGSDIGDAVQFDVTVPEAGTYTMSFRYANASPTMPSRPMDLQVNGQTVTVPFGMTPDWDVWEDLEVEVTLLAGANTVTLANTVANGPNIDSVTIFNDVTPPPTPSEPGVRETIRINFQDGSTPVDPDYLVGNFTDYGLQSNGLTYGFVTENSVLDADGTTNTPTGSTFPDIAINERSGSGTLPDDGSLPTEKLSVNFNTMDPRLTGYAHFDLSSFPERTAWEIELENGWYEVTVSVGDTGGANDSDNRLFVEGALVTEWSSTSAFKTELLTTLAHVQDGHLTLSAQGGSITEMQYLEIRALPDLTPGDGNEAPDDYAAFINPRAVSTDGEVELGIHDGVLPTDIDPTSDIVLGVSVVDGRGGVLLESLEDGSIRIYETLTGLEVAYNANTTGGFDSVTIAPVTDLKPYTSYTVVIDGFRDRGDNDDSAALTREFQKFTTTFTTGAAPLVEAREVAFVDTVELSSNPMLGESYTSIEMSPDKQFLYVTSITGSITRWAVNADGSLDDASKEVYTPLGDFVVGAERRGIIGIAFDPEDENTIWITDNYPIPLNGRSNSVPDFSGRISKVTLGDGGSLEDATIETYITGLPRSNGDHVTNSLEFRLNPDYVPGGDEPQYLLYLTQGSNSAMGEPDSAWGNRPERLLNAAILEIDRSREAPEGGFDVSTEPLPADGQNRRYADTDNDLKNGGIAITDGIYVGNYLHFDENGVAEVRTGEDASSELIVRYYDPFAEDAVLSIFAEGNRNAYDLVWHSNGYLYVPTNGSAAGGNVPDDPSTPEDESINNVGLQADYLFRMVEDGYYGHPNPLRDRYILNGANPTSGTDPNQVGNYPVGTDPDPDYDLEGAYNLGNNRSPNGAIEYMSAIFGTSLQHAVIFTQYSSGDNLRAVLLNEDGTVAEDFILTDVNGNEINYVDPLDVIEGADGRLYMLTLNRANGVSQIIRLEAAPGGEVEDTTADEGGNLGLLVISAADASSVLFQVVGLDPDIQSLTISFDGGPAQAVTLDAQNRFSLDLSGQTEQVSATLTVNDDDGNSASTSTSFTPGDSASGNFIDASAFTVLDTDDGTLIRLLSDPSTHEAGGGTYDTNGDGMNDGYTGAGYLDMNGGAEDKASFVYDAPSAGSYTLTFRMANGSGTPRPVAIIAGIQTVQIPTTETGSFATWQEFSVTLDLSEGPNTVVIEQLASNGGPNIDSVAVIANVPSAPNDGSETVGGVTYIKYEAENAVLDGAVVADDNRNQSGDFVDFDGTGTQSITWTVSVTEAGIYGIDILYALATTKAARPASLFVNGVDQGILAFDPNSSAAEDVWGPQSAQISLNPGLNTISISVPDANGANIDYLRVSEAPVDTFVPAYAAIDGEGRIELEATDDTTRTLGATQVEFYFTVSEDDTYALDLAANAGAPNGAGLTVFLSANGAQPVEIGDIAFPGEGDAGETSAYVELLAGVQYKLTVLSDQAGASSLDYLDVRPAPGNDNADIEIQSNDAAYFDNRLHFSWIDDPDAVAGTDRDYKESATVTISNSGTETLEFLESTITGPFELADPDIFEGLTLAAGQSINVQVLFDRSAYTAGSGNVSGVFKGALDIRTNDADTPVARVDLAGFWQSQDEGGQEPNLNEVWDVFGFGNEISGLSYSSGGGGGVLDFFDLYLSSDETEVLSPYWRIAEGVTEARITQIAAFHSPSGASIRFHAPGDTGSDVGMTSHISSNNQSLLPLSSSSGAFATRVFTAADIPDGWAGNDLFGIEINNQSTDPRLNPTGAGTPTQAQLDARYPGAGYTVVNGQVFDAEGNEVSDGYTVRMYQAVDEDGNVIENVFLGVMDYTGINYDYNDNMFVIEGVAPVYYGAVTTIEGLDDAAADDRLVFSRIDNPANGDQAFRDTAVLTITNDGISNLTIDDLAVSGNFTISGLTEGQVIAPGASAQLTVTFIGIDPNDDGQATAHEGTLTIGSNGEVRQIALAGLAQIQSEGGEEPTVAQIVQAFGYSTDVAQGLLSNGGVVETVGDEVLLPYLQRLDDSKPIEVIQLAAYLSAGVSRLSLHDVSNGALTELYAQDDNQYQTLLPDGLISGAGAQSGVARASIDSDDPFGLRVTVDGRPTFSAWSDPDANVADDTYDISPPNEGHYIRFFQAKDALGNVIEGTFIGIQDYPGGSNFDYNDHMFLITNVQGYELSAEEDANGDGINDALVTDSDLDGTPDFFDADSSPAPVQEAYPGPAPVLDDSLTVLAANFDSGGQGISWNDDPGRDGTHPLRADTDVELVGSTNDIGYIQSGEWVEYTIDVAQAGSYALSVNAKTPIGGNSVVVTLEDGTPLATFALPDSNGTSNTFSGTVFAATAATNVSLAAGLQTLRFTFEGAPASNGYILDFRSFSLEQVSVDPEPEDNVAPVVDAVIAADITVAGAATASVVVTFSDDVALDASSIDVSDITVTGPNGPLTVTGVSLDAAGNGSPRSATYTVAAPGGSWDVTDNGAYTVALQAGQVLDTSGNAVAANATLASFDVTVPDSPPPEDNVVPVVDAVIAADITVAGAATASVVVTFSDDVALDASSIDVSDITVTGPNGPLTVTGVSLDAAGNGSPRSATYTVAAPGGSWDTADNGAYTVALQAGQVLDTSGNAVAANGALTSFNVAVPVTPPPTSIGETFRVEAETLTLQGFVATANGHASNDAFIQAPGSGPNVASLVFAETPGTYQITAGHYDESDGNSVLSLMINNEVRETFTWNLNAGDAIANSSS